MAVVGPNYICLYLKIVLHANRTIDLEIYLNDLNYGRYTSTVHPTVHAF